MVIAGTKDQRNLEKNMIDQDAGAEARTDAFRRLEEFIQTSDLTNKPRKLDGLHRAYYRRIPLKLVGETMLLDGIAIDPSELENGNWL